MGHQQEGENVRQRERDGKESQRQGKEVAWFVKMTIEETLENAYDRQSFLAKHHQ